MVINGLEDVGVYGVNSCSGEDVNLDGDFATWGSPNTAIATMTTGQVRGVAAGATTGFADGLVPGPGGGCGCGIPHRVQPTALATVFDVGINGKSYIFVGSDPNELYGNRYQVGNSALTAGPQPPGGTASATSSDTSDAITQVEPSPPEFQFKTLDQSANVGDRTLTFKYALPSGASTSVRTNVTARKFAYVANNSPSNQCSLSYGTYRQYVYTVYTHPDETAVLGSDGLSNTAVTESFSPALQCTTITGSGSLNADAQFQDTVSSLCSSQPLTCTQTTTQSFSVAGYPVRSNTLQWTGTGVSYTSNGPTQ